MSYSHRETDGIDIIELEDSIDLYISGEIKKFLKTILNKPEPKIILSMKNLKFMDSSGIGMVISLFTECNQKGIQLRLANLSTIADTFLRKAKIKDYFVVYDTVGEAIDSLR